jgi:hypothetical protein
MSSNISDDNRQIARIIDGAFGGDWSVGEWANADKNIRLNVLSSPDRPEPGLTSFCTIGLSDYPIPGEAHPPLGMEIVGVSHRKEFADVLAAAGFYAIKHGWKLKEGTLIAGLSATYMEDFSLPHLLLINPFLWDDELANPRALSDKTVGWLLGVSVSTAEMEFLQQHGFAALEDHFEEAQPDFFDLERPSTV